MILALGIREYIADLCYDQCLRLEILLLRKSAELSNQCTARKSFPLQTFFFDNYHLPLGECFH